MILDDKITPQNPYVGAKEAISKLQVGEKRILAKSLQREIDRFQDKSTYNHSF